MANVKYVIHLTLILACSLLVSCAGSSSTVQQNSPAYQAPETYPEWYNENRSVVDDEEVYRGYAVVLASDSSATVRRAVQRAKSRLGSSISNKLESIRNDALVEYGSASNLDESNFILALNKSGRTIRQVAEMSNGEVRLQDSSENYFGFAEVTLNKEDLIERLDRSFSAHEKAWNSMKESRAFTKF